MPKMMKMIACLVLLYSLAISCGDRGKQQPVIPEASELTVLMLSMFEETKQIKQQMTKGDSITIALNHEGILSAQASDPEKVASAEYKVLAKTYLELLNNFKTASADEKSLHFDNLVNNCLACHRSFCPGPIPRIQQLQ